MSKTYLTFEQIRKNKFKTGVLILSMLLLVLAACVALGYAMEDIRGGVVYGMIFAIIVFAFSFWQAKYSMLRRTHSVELDPSTPQGRRVIPIVERVAAAANIPMPKVYLLESDSPNAFASGFSPKSAFMGVTRGLLDTMNDAELEGVIAHEVSHIANYDVLICMAGYAMVSVFIAASSLRYLRLRPSNDSKNNGMMVVLVLIVVSLVGRLIASILNLAISRKREFIADANAVRLCANNGGLISALEKLSQVTVTPNQVRQLGGEELMGMYINTPKKAFLTLFSTHPPIEKRIEILKNMA